MNEAALPGDICMTEDWVLGSPIQGLRPDIGNERRASPSAQSVDQFPMSSCLCFPLLVCRSASPEIGFPFNGLSSQRKSAYDPNTGICFLIILRSCCRFSSSSSSDRRPSPIFHDVLNESCHRCFPPFLSLSGTHAKTTGRRKVLIACPEDKDMRRGCQDGDAISESGSKLMHVIAFPII